MQWFNRESEQSRKNIISDILGHFARTAYQQKPEFNQNAASELIKLCDRLQPPAIQAPEPIVVPSSNDTVDITTDTLDSKHQQAIELWNAGGLSWASITEKLGEDAATWKAFSQAVKRFAAKSQQSLRSGRVGAKRPSKTIE